MADAADPASLDRARGATRVLATTVGPYARYGLPVVEACAQAGTHYADLTGEVLFVREAIDRFDARGRASPAPGSCTPAASTRSRPTSASCCSPSGRRPTARAAWDRRPLVAALKGGFSGGTIDSMRAQVEAVRATTVAAPHRDRPVRAEPRPVRRAGPRQPSDAGPPARTPDGRWTAPFVMASFNTRIVRRSNALQDWSYGRGFRYSEVMGVGSGRWARPPRSA